MNAICLVIDRLHHGYLGAYGNGWIETPSIDRLACEAFTFDQMQIETPDLGLGMRALWQGVHPRSNPTSLPPSLADRLKAADVITSLITDSETIAGDPLAETFGELVELPSPEKLLTADSADETHLAGCFSRLLDLLDTQEGPFLVWNHLSGMNAGWDAPYDFRARYMEEGDPEPGQFVEPPHFELNEGFDPDLLLNVSQAYAGQVTLLDLCVGAMLEYLEESGLAENTMLFLLSARGLALGEHRHVGLEKNSLFGELTHVPAMVRLPDGTGAAGRTQALATPRDLHATLLDWFGLETNQSPATGSQNLLPLIRGEAETVRDRLLVVGTNRRRPFEPRRYLRQNREGTNLYVKPDDRWEINDVIDRCSEEVRRLRAVSDEYLDAVENENQNGNELTPLDPILIEGPE